MEYKCCYFGFYFHECLEYLCMFSFTHSIIQYQLNKTRTALVVVYALVWDSIEFLSKYCEKMLSNLI
jgi:hypothetical protein